MLDAEAVSGWIDLRPGVVHVEDFRDGAVADGMNADLQFRMVRAAASASIFARGFINGRGMPRFDGSSAKGSNIQAVPEPSDPSANALTAPSLTKSSPCRMHAAAAQLLPMRDGDDLVNAASQPTFPFGAAKKFDFAGIAAIPRIRIDGDGVNRRSSPRVRLPPAPHAELPPSRLRKGGEWPCAIKSCAASLKTPVGLPRRRAR